MTLGFAGVMPGVVGGATATVAIEDDDERGVDVSPSAVMIPEGNSGNYEVTLSSQPTDTVTVTVESDNDDVTMSLTSLVFTTNNWAETQTVTVDVGMDADAETTLRR